MAIASIVVPLTDHMAWTRRALEATVAPFFAGTISVTALGDAVGILASGVARLALAREITVRSGAAGALAVGAFADTIRIFCNAVDVTWGSVADELTTLSSVADARPIFTMAVTMTT